MCPLTQASQERQLSGAQGNQLLRIKEKQFSDGTVGKQREHHLVKKKRKQKRKGSKKEKRKKKKEKKFKQKNKTKRYYTFSLASFKPRLEKTAFRALKEFEAIF